MQVELNGGLILHIDEEDLDLYEARKWRIFSKAFPYLIADITVNNKATTCRLHREILAKYHRVTKSCKVDHIDGNPLNNCKENLRLVSSAQNNYNAKINKRNTTGYKGVKNTKDGYRVDIVHNYTPIHLGYYDDLEEAALVYNRKAIELFGEYAKLNLTSLTDNGQRILTKKEKRRLASSSKYYGVVKTVYPNKTSYTARLTVNGKKHYLGTFDEEIDAAKAINEFIIANHLLGTHYRYKLNEI